MNVYCKAFLSTSEKEICLPFPNIAKYLLFTDYWKDKWTDG